METKSTLIMMCGVICSGKSVAAHELAAKYDAKVFSYEEYEHDNSNMTKENIFDKIMRDINKELMSGKNAIYDSLNITMRSRRRVKEACKKNAKDLIICVMDTSIDNCYNYGGLKLNGNIPRQIIFNSIAEFEFPQKFEGFSKVMLYNQIGKLKPPKYNKEKCDKILDKTHFLIYNKHQETLTLFSHLMQTHKNAGDNYILQMAGVYHDLGEILCAGDKNYTRYHANYSTYYLMCNLDILFPCKDTLKWDDVYKILFYINYHSKAIVLEYAKRITKNKYRQLFGEELFDNLLKFREIDTNSCIKD